MRAEVPGHLEVHAVVHSAKGRWIDLGRISSPHKNRVRNWLWKKRRGRQIRKQVKPLRG